MRSSGMLLAASMLVCFFGCADSGGSNNEPVIIDISGTVHPHPLAVAYAGETEVDFTQILVAVINPLHALGGGDIVPLSQTVVGVEGACPVGATYAFDCAYTLVDVDITGATMGLVAPVDDAPGAAEDRWAPAANAIPKDLIAGRMEDPTPLTGVTLFGLTNSALTKLESVIKKSPGQLLQSGFVIGRVLDASGNPVEGATLSDRQNLLEFLFLAADWSWSDGGNTSTASHGVFIAVPLSAASELVLTQVDAVKEGLTFQVEASGFTGGAVVLMTMQAD